MQKRGRDPEREPCLAVREIADFRYADRDGFTIAIACPFPDPYCCGPLLDYRSIPKPMPAELSPLLNAPPMLKDARSPIGTP